MMAGKGSTPRPVDRAKWDSCPLWLTREQRKQADREAREQDESELHEQIETAKVEYDERDA